MKFLIIRFSSIGDIVLTTPVIRCLRKRYPEAEIHFLTKHAFRQILEANPYLDKIHTLGESFELMLHELKVEAYDHIIDLHHNVRTLRIKQFLKEVPSSSFNKLNLRKFIYTSLKINLLPAKHIVDRYFECIASLAVINDGAGLDYFIPEKDKIKQNDIPTSHQLGYIGLVIGAAHNTKKLPVDKLMEVCRGLNYPVIILGGKEDLPVAVQLAAIDPVRIYNACGKFNLNESAAIVKEAKLIITHDTGLMHIAAAFQRQIISIWGNTVPSFGMYPYFGEMSNRKADIIQVNKLWCRPCSKIGYDKCPLGHFKCMRNIAVNDIVNLAHQRLGK